MTTLTIQGVRIKYEDFRILWVKIRLYCGITFFSKNAFPVSNGPPKFEKKNNCFFFTVETFIDQLRLKSVSGDNF